MTMSSDEAARVRGYLVSQAHKLSLQQLVEKVRNDALPLQGAADAVPPQRFFERPTSEQWSAAEVFTHILDMSESGADAIEGIIARGAPPEPARDQRPRGPRVGLQTAADYWQVYSERRQRLYERVLAAHGDEHLDMTIEHFLFGPLNWREWLLFMRVHDVDHLRQLQAIAEQLQEAGAAE